MQYPIVYDRFTTDFDNLGLAILDKAKNVKVTKKLSGERTLTLWLPRNDPKWQHIQPENYIKVDGQLYRIKTTDEQRDSTGKLIANIQCNHVWYDAADCKFLPDVEYIGMTPHAILRDAFNGTRFTVSSEVATMTDIWDSKSNPAKILNKIIENVGGEIDIDNWTIVHKEKIGQNKGVVFKIGKNIASIKRTVDTSNLITRLYPLGKDDMPLGNDTGYIDSPNINKYDYPHIGYKEYKDIDDPAELMETALKEFAENHIDEPEVSYRAEVAELKKLAIYGGTESFDLGDTVRCIDEGLELDTKQRIVEYEYYPYEPQKSVVVLSNSIKGIVNLIVKLVEGNHKLNNVLDAKDYIKKIADEAVGEKQLVDLSVTYQKLADAAVTTRALADLSVDTSKLAYLSITAAQLADSSVEATKIANAAVGSAAIAQAAIGSAHIGEGVILNAHIGNAQIDDAKIANLAVEKLIGTYITGKTVRTAATGTRVELNGSTLAAYIDNTERFKIDYLTFADEVILSWDDLQGAVYRSNSNGNFYILNNKEIHLSGTTVKLYNYVDCSGTYRYILPTASYIGSESYSNLVATHDWVQSQGYATHDWVQSQGYATQYWVNNQNYAFQYNLDQVSYNVNYFVGWSLSYDSTTKQLSLLNAAYTPISTVTLS